MKSISGAIVVLSGALIMVASSLQGMSNRDALFNAGAGVIIAGIVGWAAALRMDK